MWVGGQRHDPAALPPRKTRYPFVSKAGWVPGSVWTGAENLAPPRFDPRIVQPLASRYTDGAIPGHMPVDAVEYQKICFVQEGNSHDLTEPRNISPCLQEPTTELPTSHEFQHCGVIWHIWSYCVLVTEMSPWRWQYYRPKHAVENTTIKILIEEQQVNDTNPPYELAYTPRGQLRIP
jgi:hypothetical protein